MLADRLPGEYLVLNDIANHGNYEVVVFLHGNLEVHQGFYRDGGDALRQDAKVSGGSPRSSHGSDQTVSARR